MLVVGESTLWNDEVVLILEWFLIDLSLNKRCGSYIKIAKYHTFENPGSYKEKIVIGALASSAGRVGGCGKGRKDWGTREGQGGCGKVKNAGRTYGKDRRGKKDKRGKDQKNY